MARPRRGVLTAFLLVALVSTGIVVAFRSILPSSLRANDNSDFTSFYEPVALRLVEGNGLTMPSGKIAIRYPPGYPLLLAASFVVGSQLSIPWDTTLNVLICGLTGLAAGLVFLTASVFWSLRNAVLVALCFTTYPLVLWMAKQPNSEIPFLIPLYAGVLLLLLSLERGYLPAALACGACIGAATLIRPITIGFGFVAAALVLTLRRDAPLRVRGALAALILLGNTLVLAPWERWVYDRTGIVVMVSSAGKKAIRDGLSFAGSKKAFREPVTVPPAAAELVRRVEVEWDKGNLMTMRALVTFLRAELAQRPLGVLELFAVKAARSWYATDSHRNERVVIGIQAVYLALIGLAGWRAYRAGGPIRRLACVVFAVATYFWLMTIVALSIARYMAPAAGLLITLLPAILPGRAWRGQTAGSRDRGRVGAG